VEQLLKYQTDFIDRYTYVRSSLSLTGGREETPRRGGGGGGGKKAPQNAKKD